MCVVELSMSMTMAHDMMELDVKNICLAVDSSVRWSVVLVLSLSVYILLVWRITNQKLRRVRMVRMYQRRYLCKGQF